MFTQLVLYKINCRNTWVESGGPIKRLLQKSAEGCQQPGQGDSEYILQLKKTEAAGWCGCREKAKYDSKDSV